MVPNATARPTGLREQTPFSPSTATRFSGGLSRLIERGSLTGHPIYFAQQVDPIRVVERSPTSLGLGT